MPTAIQIEIGNLTLEAELDNTPTARAIVKALPIETDFETWGDLYHFEIPVKLPLDDTATLEVQVGDLGYWPPRKSMTIFYGPTPATPSDSDRPVPASEVNLIGRLVDDPTILRVVAGIGHLRIARRSRRRKKKT
ncbi:MAG: cyclophilin-like fold protein [Candidatus Eiseniibacteriota bacterium]|jgi:hypothetical protein